MNLILKAAVAAMILTAAAPLTVEVAFAQSASACTEAGRQMVFEGVPADAKSGVPNQLRKTLGALAIMAVRSSCNVALTCVATDGGDAARDVARQQCVVVRDILVRANRGKGWGKENITTSRKNPGGGLQAGSVYLSLT